MLGGDNIPAPATGAGVSAFFGLYFVCKNQKPKENTDDKILPDSSKVHQ